jgi:hypothetical protein
MLGAILFRTVRIRRHHCYPCLCAHGLAALNGHEHHITLLHVEMGTWMDANIKQKGNMSAHLGPQLMGQPACSIPVGRPSPCDGFASCTRDHTRTLFRPVAVAVAVNLHRPRSWAEKVCSTSISSGSGCTSGLWAVP